jgi:hypothetical protein
MPAVKHIALVKFKSGTSEQKIKELFEALEQLKKSIPGILDYCDGINSSPEGLEQGFTHGFIMTFKDAAARDAYLPHPEHERVKARILPYVESAIIFDFDV